jgi:hypothetical protein
MDGCDRHRRRSRADGQAVPAGRLACRRLVVAGRADRPDRNATGGRGRRCAERGLRSRQRPAGTGAHAHRSRTEARRRGAPGGAATAGCRSANRSAQDDCGDGDRNLGAFRRTWRLDAGHASRTASCAARDRLAVRAECARRIVRWLAPRLCVVRGDRDSRLGARDSGFVDRDWPARPRARMLAACHTALAQEGPLRPRR